MPGTGYTQSDRNLDACAHLESESPKYADWEITTLFYSAMHLVSDHLKKQNIEVPKSHKRMSALLSVMLPEIFQPYSALLKLSWNARYNGYDAVKNCKSRAVGYHEQIAAALRRRDSVQGGYPQGPARRGLRRSARNFRSQLRPKTARADSPIPATPRRLRSCDSGGTDVGLIASGPPASVSGPG